MTDPDFGEFTLIDSMPALIWVSGVDHAGTYFNRTWLEFTGRTLEQEQGDGWIRGVHPDDHVVLKECLSAFEQREPFQIEFRLRRHDGEYRWMLDHGVPRFSSGGTFAGFIGSCLDITDRKLAEERQSVLLAELNHRVRNTLASIRAMLRLSVSGARSKEAFAASLEGRIDAYAKAHGLLAAQHWEGASLSALISAVLAPYIGGAEHRVQLTGPDATLHPAAALSFSLLIHEMATNAAKHGALSARGGTVRVTWVLANGQITLLWEERGGPPVSLPLSRGFGSSLIEDLPENMGGSGKLELLASGLRWRVELPIVRTLKRTLPFSSGEARQPHDAPVPAVGGCALDGKRILVTEDDPLIGQELKAAFRAAGATVIGPLTNVASALSAATEQEIDGAVLDVNLRGELVVPVASLLRERDVPFLLMTGYAHANLPAELHSTPMLQKPFSPAAIIDRLSDLMDMSGRPSRPESHERKS